MKTESIQNTMTNYVNSIERRINVRVPSEFYELCSRLRDRLTLIAGNPAMGCSTLAVTMALQLAKAGARVLYIAHPRQRIQYFVSKFICVESGQEWDSMHYDEQRVKALKDNFGVLDNLNFFYSSMQSPQTIENLKAVIYNAAGNFEIDYVFIDSLEDFMVEEHHLELESKKDYLCRNLYDLSEELNIPVVAIAKYDFDPKYDCNENGEVILGNILREAGYFSHAKNIFFLYRPEYHHIYKDEKTGEDLRRLLFVYTYHMGISPSNSNPPIRLMFDGKNARVTKWPVKSEDSNQTKVDNEPSLYDNNDGINLQN